MKTLNGTIPALLLIAHFFSQLGFGQACPPSAPDGYRLSNTCTVTIDRDNPASPATIVVPGNTRVLIRVVNARANEAISFTPTTTQAPPVDVAGTFLKSAISPLQSLIINQMASTNRMRVPLNRAPPNDPIAASLNAMLDEINSVLALMADASVRLSCLEAYRIVSGSAGDLTCAPGLLSSGSFMPARQATIDSLLAAAKAPLPLASSQYAAQRIKDDITTSSALPDQTARGAALARDDEYSSALALINAAVADAQKTQTTMLENAEQLAVLANAGPEVDYFITRQKSYSASVVIVAQEVISKNNTTVSTVTINWQSNQWEISTGILFSALRSRTFSNAPSIVAGVPQLDSSGKTLTVVQESDTRPTVVFPVVLANYRIRALSNFGWENKCPNHCAFLLSGGVGLNTEQKSAEFAAGASFQLGSVLLTPAAHIGRDTELTQGVTVGAQLGSGPPSPLPTTSRWTVKLGFSVSYVLPF